MKQFYQNAILQGADQITTALGFVEKNLTRNPDDLRAKAYKGALLAMLGITTDPKKRDIYVEGGIRILKEVNSLLSPKTPDYVEILFVVTTALGWLAHSYPSADFNPTQLDHLIEVLDFNTLSIFEMVYTLVLASKLAEESGEISKKRNLMKRARALDLGLALKIKALLSCHSA